MVDLSIAISKRLPEGFSMVFPGMPDTDADHILPALVLVAGVKVFNFLGEGHLRRSDAERLSEQPAIIRAAEKHRKKIDMAKKWP